MLHKTKKVLTFAVPTILALSRRVRLHHSSAFAAQIAFFFFLSLFPFITIFITIAGKMIDLSTVLAAIDTFGALPQPIKELVLDFFVTAQGGHLSILSVSFLTILWSSSRAYYSLVHAYGNSECIEQSPILLLERIKGLFFTVLLAIILTLAALLPSLSYAVIARLVTWLSLPNVATYLILITRWLVYLFVLTTFVGGTYYFLPKRKKRFRDVLPGTLLTLAVWWLQSLVFNKFIVQFAKFSAIYGTLAAVVICMLWLYSLAYTLILGAELNAHIQESKPLK